MQWAAAARSIGTHFIILHGCFSVHVSDCNWRESCCHHIMASQVPTPHCCWQEPDRLEDWQKKCQRRGTQFSVPTSCNLWRTISQQTRAQRMGRQWVFGQVRTNPSKRAYSIGAVGNQSFQPHLNRKVRRYALQDRGGEEVETATPCADNGAPPRSFPSTEMNNEMNKQIRLRSF